MEKENPKTNFVREIIDEHNQTKRFHNKVHTRYPFGSGGNLVRTLL